MRNVHQRRECKRHAFKRSEMMCAVMEQKKNNKKKQLQMAHQQRGTDRPVDDVQQRRV